MRIRRKTVWGICGAALVLAGALVVLTIQGRRNRDKIPGVYLADGGVACLVIGRNLEVEKNYLYANTEFRISAAKIGQGFRLDGTYPSSGPYGFEWDLAYSFSPSRTRPGDWDLVAFGPNELYSLPRAMIWIRMVRQALALGHTLCDPLTRTVPCLCRVDDPNVAEYFGLQYDNQNPKAAFEKARLLLERHPDDPHIRALYLSAAALNNDTSEVARRWEEWKPQVEDPADPCLAYANREMERWLRSRRLSAAGRNAYDLLQKIRDSAPDVPPWPGVLSVILACEGYVPDWFSGFELDRRPPHLTGLTDLARHLCAFALLDMFEGNGQESLSILAAIHHLGQLMSERDNLLEVMLGIIFRGISLEGLKVYALNCGNNGSDFKELWEVLERLERNGGAVGPGKIRTREMSFGDYLPQDFSIVEPRIQDKKIAETEFDLLRMATAARFRLVTQGVFPKSNEEFAPLLPQGPPRDPFGDGPLRFRMTTDSLVCYSIGPEEDDRTRSEISIKVPRVREYPFPRGGVRATSVEDVARQFPNGLPIDPWANCIGTTVTTTGDVLVYSGGPSGPGSSAVYGDFEDWLTGTSHALTLQYDPTNGISSPGGLFIRLPRR